MLDPSLLQSFYDRLPWTIQPVFRKAYRRYELRRFEKMRRDTNGMLSATVYERIYKAASDQCHGNALEIGGAHGASTIALAMGLQKGRSESTVVTVEKGEGGSRTRYGSKQENLKTLRDNLSTYGVADSVEIVPKWLKKDEPIPESILENSPYSIICIDADGELHRDFSLLYDLLEPGAVVIIDDYSMKRDYTEKKKSKPLGGGKYYRTFCYLTYFLESGYVVKRAEKDGTFFGVKSLTKNYDPPTEDISKIQEHLERDRQRYE